MLLFRTGLLALSLAGCYSPTDSDNTGWPYSEYESPSQYGTGGTNYGPDLTLPFKSGEYWMFTQGFNTGSHRDYGFTYGNDSFAMDFSQAACDAYGKDVTPILSGTVDTVNTVDSAGDDGYGNNILIESADGYMARYAHLSAINVEVGQSVTEDTVLGQVGSTGNVSGTACADHPGTHLHLAFYHDESAVQPLPLSVQEQMTVGCWYNREGNEACSGDHSNYDPVEDTGDGSSGGDDSSDDDNGVIENDSDGLNVAFLDISPEQGTNDSTQYTWVSTVVTDGGEPDVTLSIVNPNDGQTYDFSMSTESRQSPWVFSYQKTLNDPSTYTYWVTAEEGGRQDQSSQQQVGVDSENGEMPWFESFSLYANGDRDYTWTSTVNSDDEPEVNLMIVNPSDAVIYSFPMDVDDNGNDWISSYEKTLRDATVYTYWFEATDGGSTQNSSVLSMETE